MITRAALKGLHRLMPVKETVSYYVRQKADQFSEAVTVQSAEWRPTTVDHVQLIEAGLQRELRDWFLWTEKLGSIRPAIGDKLTQTNGTTWIVAAVSEELGGARWRVTSTKGLAG